MIRVLRLVPKLCFAVAALLFASQSYYLVRGIMRGYEYGFAVDLTGDLSVQFAVIFLKVAVNALVWIAYGLLAQLLIRAIDDLNATCASVLSPKADEDAQA